MNGRVVVKAMERNGIGRTREGLCELGVKTARPRGGKRPIGANSHLCALLSTADSAEAQAEP